LFLAFAGFAEELDRQPQWYNTLLDNCTTVPLRIVRTLNAGIPLDWRILASGRLPAYLHDLGVLRPDLGLAEVEAKAVLPVFGPWPGEGCLFPGDPRGLGALGALYRAGRKAQDRVKRAGAEEAGEQWHDPDELGVMPGTATPWSTKNHSRSCSAHHDAQDAVDAANIGLEHDFSFRAWFPCRSCRVCPESVCDQVTQPDRPAVSKLVRIAKPHMSAFHRHPAIPLECLQPARNHLARAADPGGEFGLRRLDQIVLSQVDQGPGQPHLDPAKGHLLQKVGKFGHALAEGTHDKAAKAIVTIQKPKEQDAGISATRASVTAIASPE
jgi:hypothetical protein